MFNIFLHFSWQKSEGGMLKYTDLFMCHFYSIYNFYPKYQLVCFFRQKLQKWVYSVEYKTQLLQYLLKASDTVLELH